ncbi:MAG TPA: iron-containing alcohol dehydrogenase [Anaerolineales bacterium]
MPRKSSRPASGSEHQFSHLWEMQGVHAPHGFKVGLGSLAMAALYEKLLEQDFEPLDIPGLCRAWPTTVELEQAVRASFANPTLADRGVEESLVKHLTPEQLAARLRLLQQAWPSLREKLSRQVWPVETMRRKLAAAGCPVDPQEIGLDEQQVQQSYALARRIRRRYTALDLAAETGWLP